MKNYAIDPDIKLAYTLDTSFYTSQKIFKLLKKKVFKSSWQFAGDVFELNKNNCIPLTINNEDLILTNHNDKMRCLTNVCTHRGNILIKDAGIYKRISCRYHGRCFKLNGHFHSMPEFQNVKNFPSSSDDLGEFPLEHYGPFLFSNLSQNPGAIDNLLGPLKKEMSWYPFDRLKAAPQLNKTYQLNANWALYCDNYLEGFHVPFVHEKLNDTIEYGSYTTEIIDNTILQTGIAKEGEAHFNDSHGYDGNNKIYAYYWFLFPNLMINFYTWGVSINIVKPVNKSRTNIEFRTYLLDTAESKDFDQTYLHETEMEDEEIVLDVQRGIQSSFYNKGRYSPTKEQGVHYFHQLLTESI